MRVRVVTFNVRRFVDSFGTNAVPAALSALGGLHPISLLALQEVDVALRPDALQQAAEQLALPHVAFWGHVRGVYGNALLSAAALTNERHIHLDGGCEVTSKSGARHRIVRGLLKADTVVGGMPLRVAVTHLDHMVEAERRAQAAHILRELSADEGPSAQLLLGDLNALRRDDYTAEQWAAHAAHNSSRGWVAPVDSFGEVGGALYALHGAGFEDCVRDALWQPRPLPPPTPPDAAGGGGGAWAAPPWSAHAHVANGPRYRIDYVLSRHLGGWPKLRVAAAAAEPSGGEAASDHLPVLVDFDVCHEPARL